MSKIITKLRKEAQEFAYKAEKRQLFASITPEALAAWLREVAAALNSLGRR